MHLQFNLTDAEDAKRQGELTALKLLFATLLSERPDQQALFERCVIFGDGLMDGSSSVHMMADLATGYQNAISEIFALAKTSRDAKGGA